jgi:hypothetical protein
MIFGFLRAAASLIQPYQAENPADEHPEGQRKKPCMALFSSLVAVLALRHINP